MPTTPIATLSSPVDRYICQGFDKVFGNVRNVAMQGQRSLEGGFAVEMRYKVCQSMDGVRSMLQMDQSSILGLFEAGSHISDKLQFLESLNLTTNSLAIVVFAKVITGILTIKNASLSVAAPQNHEEVEEFVRLYGDSYVAKVVTGAEYYASFTYHATTCQEKMDLLSKMKADGVFSWGSGHANLDRNIAKFNSSIRNVNVSMEFYQTVRGISGVALPEPTNLLEFVLKLPSLTIDKPQILHVQSVGYEHALGFPVCHFSSVIRNRLLIVEDRDFLSLLSQVKCLESNVQTIVAMLRRYGMYVGSVRSFLDKVKGALKSDRAAVQFMMQDYRGNVMKDGVRRPTAFKSLEYRERVESSYWTEEKSNYIGGGGGDKREYVTNVQNFMSSNRRIVSIEVRSGGWIDRISVRYSNNDKFECGGQGGNGPPKILHVPEGVYVSSIRIKDNGRYVSYLEFKLTDGNCLCCGDVKSRWGKEITYEPYKAPNYHYFCGFQARSGGYVDALRPVFAKFQM